MLIFDLIILIWAKMKVHLKGEELHVERSVTDAANPRTTPQIYSYFVSEKVRDINVLCDVVLAAKIKNRYRDI
jgi:hypothetical protein